MANIPVSGFIRDDGNGNFSSIFVLQNGLTKLFNGRFSSGLPSFAASVSQTEYSSVGDLEGDYEIGDNATVGPTTLNLPLAKGKDSITITDKIVPSLPKAYYATGSGQCHSS
ncbi:uncharacterized protein N7469_005101 [Penicillium citrinum]|uniref:Uncharacterized protein n=2 Tax=Penicillium TaxID=5073 RepID=A0A9W9TNS1_PENCI|nr:uncharacterized protein N7469_005101 [Penicillium citrinum]KAJ5233335.1 hypothetical protein N7469_005101 [Penicillium citrinum]KAJ5573198.1 hypothetical protein N7450_010182 [Penicillium hetheringtonii]KAK5790721.1 hypothetical protein VI817_008008 [Penicillium citrinum]